MNKDGETLEDRLHEEWRIEWDGEPKMGGGYHTQATGKTWRRRDEAQTGLKVLSQTGSRPNMRIVHRWASEWEDV